MLRRYQQMRLMLMVQAGSRSVFVLDGCRMTHVYVNELAGVLLLMLKLMLDA